MASSARRSWTLAEDRCFQYLKQELQVVSDTVAYSPELPATFGNGSDQQMWAFNINGAGTTDMIIVSQTAKPACTWNAGAKLFGIFNSRETTQEVAGLVMDAVPLNSGELPGIVYFNYTGFPEIERDEILLSNDQSSGGSRLIWTLTINMVVVFGNERN